MTVDARTRDLFIAAARRVERDGLLPVNVSAINDKMRIEARDWNVVQWTGGTFSMLCKYFEREGLLKLDNRKSGVQVV
jgi:hypothetical protein